MTHSIWMNYVSGYLSTRSTVTTIDEEEEIVLQRTIFNDLNTLKDTVTKFKMHLDDLMGNNKHTQMKPFIQEGDHTSDVKNSTKVKQGTWVARNNLYNIKGGCQSGRKVVPRDSKSDLSGKSIIYIF